MHLPVSIEPSKSSEYDNDYFGPRATSITLSSALSTGQFRWSQVYCGTVDDWGEVSNNNGDLPSSVAIKLYLPSALDRNQPHKYWEAEHLGDHPQESQQHMVARESMAYRRLVGCPVTPKWYGTYDVCNDNRIASVG
jgi:hypothetical protein